MVLVPYNGGSPFRPFDNMRQDLDHFFNNTNEWFGNNFGRGMRLSIDLHETDTELVATADIPGIDKPEDLTIRIDNHDTLTISGQVNHTSEVKDENMHRRERYSGRFERAINLPAQVSADNVKATYRNGVLEVHMEKIAGDKDNNQINVEFN
jgi:HSP20 family protein